MLNSDDLNKLNEVGTHEINLTYQGFNVSFTITIIDSGEEVVVTKITFNDETVKDELEIEEFDLANLEIIVSYSDDSTKIVKVSKSMLNSDDLNKLSEVGVHEINLTYEGFETTFNLTLINSVNEADIKQ